MNAHTPLGFDKEKFEQSEATVFRSFEKALENGTLYAIAEKTNTPFFYVEWAKFFLVFQMSPENFRFKKKMFSNELNLDWNHLRKTAKNTLKKNNQEIQQSDVRLTVISLYDIFGDYIEQGFTHTLRLQFEEANFEKVLVKKFELDQVSSYIPLKKTLQEADVDDPLYNEIKFEARRVKKLYQKKEEEYAKELRDFHKRRRSNNQLKILAQSVGNAS